MLAMTMFLSLLRDLIQLAPKQLLVTQGQGMQLCFGVTVEEQACKGLIAPGQLKVQANLEGDAGHMLDGIQTYLNCLMHEVSRVRGLSARGVCRTKANSQGIIRIESIFSCSPTIDSSTVG